MSHYMMVCSVVYIVNSHIYDSIHTEIYKHICIAKMEELTNVTLSAL